MKAKFKVVYTEEVISFLNSLEEKIRDKIAYNIGKSMYTIDNRLFKKLENTDIWEFRTLYNGIQYRLLAFWDKENETLVVATHGFIKKTQKTPLKEIAKAEKIRRLYFKSKKL